MDMEMTAEAKQLLVNVAQVAELLGLSERTVWRLVSTGEIPGPIRLGRSCRWSRKVIEMFVETKVAEMAA
ncbi:MAG: helix-turn-helix domain-containing protein [Phycisphaeraceae bacterium]|nr:helix-turn-helix domain-containing protein [Phycisphaeraceae bacterium]